MNECTTNNYLFERQMARPADGGIGMDGDLHKAGMILSSFWQFAVFIMKSKKTFSSF
jgi:hypothetical protein